ncbi:hypothetical protein ACJX0J_024743, partial [Zea mays]
DLLKLVGYIGYLYFLQIFIMTISPHVYEYIFIYIFYSIHHVYDNSSSIIYKKLPIRRSTNLLAGPSADSNVAHKSSIQLGFP